MSALSGSGQPAPAGAVVKVRLSGTLRGCAEAARRLHAVLYVISVSEPYAEAGTSRLVRVYIRARLDLHPARPPAAAAGGPQ